MDAPTFIRDISRETAFTKLPGPGDLEFWAVITVHGFRPVEKLYYAPNVCEAACEAIADVALMAGANAESFTLRINSVGKEAA